MGYAFALSPCFACERLFTCNPARVPSVLVDGVRRPVCQDCVERANRQRDERGLPPIEVPPGAYEAAEEGELWD
jgi:hypothetical protein